MVLIWTGFFLFTFLLLILDLGVVNRRPRVIPMRQALIWSAVWILIAISFALVIYDGYANHRMGLGTSIDPIDGQINDGPTAAAKYLAAYVLEKALSVDNLFVIAVIFRFLAVPAEHQHRVLVLGIVGAMILRGLMIGLGVGLIRGHHWVVYALGALLLWTGVRILLARDRPPDPSKNLAMRIARRFLPLTNRYAGGRFLTLANGRWMLTPLALSLVLIEASDAIFALDSIPAAFGVTADPLLIYTSNILAIFGLRALYFALAGMLDRFRFLKLSLSIILVSVGLKMIASPWLKQALGGHLMFYMLLWIGLLLGAGVIGSILFPISKPSWPSDSTNIVASSGSGRRPT
jgi:tellurite resistance protein TerC